MMRRLVVEIDEGVIADEASLDAPQFWTMVLTTTHPELVGMRVTSVESRFIDAEFEPPTRERAFQLLTNAAARLRGFSRALDTEGNDRGVVANVAGSMLDLAQEIAAFEGDVMNHERERARADDRFRRAMDWFTGMVAEKLHRAIDQRAYEVARDMQVHRDPAKK